MLCISCRLHHGGVALATLETVGGNAGSRERRTRETVLAVCAVRRRENFSLLGMSIFVICTLIHSTSHQAAARTASGNSVT